VATDPAVIKHLLRRTEYVARPARVTALSAGSLDAAIDNILDFTGIDTTLPAAIDHTDSANQYDQYVFAAQWWHDRMVDSPKPMQEKMTFFWHGHFTSAWNKVNDTLMMTHQNKLYRDNAVGNFYNLTQAMALEPAMLVYLDNQDNSSGSPNENFARELMELFTLGIGNYAESDVEASARAWTGFGIDWTDGSPTYGQYKFYPGDHDNGNKTFFGTTKNWDGPGIITEILVNNPTKKLIAARYIIGKLWEHFAHPGPPTAVLDALTPGFAANWDIKAMLKAMFLRAEFYSTTALQGLVRTPVDWVTALMYHSGLRSADLNPQWYTDTMGQEPWNPPNVAGWKDNAYFINTSTMGARAEFAAQISYLILPTWDHVKTETIANAIADMANLFDLNPLSTPTSNAMTSYLTAQRAAEHQGYWEPRNLLMMSMLAPELHVA